MLAVGRLHKIWSDLPADIPHMEALALEFKKVFDHNWEDVMVGSHYPFIWHQSWEAYISVQDLENAPEQMTITSLQENYRETTAFYNITLG